MSDANDVLVRDFSAPLGSVAEGRLELNCRGASGAVVHAGSWDELYRAHFEGTVPTVRVRDGTVTIEYRQKGAAAIFERGPNTADIALNGSILWRLEFPNGVSDLAANLSGLKLRSLEVRGGASRMDLVLGHPVGIVSIRVLGGASDIAIHRPADAPTRFSVWGGVAKLAWDTQTVGSMGGPVSLHSLDFDGAADRYDVEVRGGASTVTIDLVACSAPGV
jgi:hypothetical protein